jgi:hypothetical protein
MSKEFAIEPNDTFLLTRTQKCEMLEKLSTYEKKYDHLTRTNKIKYHGFKSWVEMWGDLELHELDFIEQCYGS